MWSMYEKKNRLKGYTLLKQGARLRHKYNPQSLPPNMW